MKILLANPRGFCAGVNMAIESLDRALELFGTPIYAYHEIVHNRPVVERFRTKGVVFVESMDDIPAGGTVLYSPHGGPPAIPAPAPRRRVPATAASCALPPKVHMEPVGHARQRSPI